MDSLDLLLTEALRRQDMLLGEAAHARVLSRITQPGRSLGGRTTHNLGRGLVWLGTRLLRYEHAEPAVLTTQSRRIVRM